MAIQNTAALPFSAEALSYNTKQGMPRSLGGVIYSQYGATGARSGAATASLFNASSTTSKGSLVLPAGLFNWNNGYDPAGLVPNATSAGTRIRCTGFGSIVSSGTDNILFLATATTNAGVAQTLATSAVVALASITNGTTANTSWCKLTFDIMCTAYSATVGILTTRGEFQYSAAPLTGVAPVSILIPGATAQTAVGTYDVTQALALDIQVTTAGAASVLTMQNWIIEVLN